MTTTCADQLTAAKRNFILGLVSDVEEMNRDRLDYNFPLIDYNSRDKRRNDQEHKQHFTIKLHESSRGNASLQPHFLQNQLLEHRRADNIKGMAYSYSQGQPLNNISPSFIMSSSADGIHAGASVNTTCITGPSNVSSIEQHHSMTFQSGYVAAPSPDSLCQSRQQGEHDIENPLVNPFFTSAGVKDGEIFPINVPLPSFPRKLIDRVCVLRKEVGNLTQMLIGKYGADYFAELLVGTKYHPCNRGRVSLLASDGKPIGMISSVQAELVRDQAVVQGNEAVANAHFLLTQYRNCMTARDEEERFKEQEKRVELTIQRLSSLSGIHLRASEKAKEMMANGGMAAFQRHRIKVVESEEGSNDDDNNKDTDPHGMAMEDEKVKDRQVVRGKEPTDNHRIRTKEPHRDKFSHEDNGVTLTTEGTPHCVVPAVDIIRAQILLSHILQAAERYHGDATAAMEECRKKGETFVITEEPNIVIDKKVYSDEERYRDKINQYRSNVSNVPMRKDMSGEEPLTVVDVDHDEDDSHLVPKAARLHEHQNRNNIDPSYRTVDQWRRGNEDPRVKPRRINDNDRLQDNDFEGIDGKGKKMKDRMRNETEKKISKNEDDYDTVPTLLTSFQKDSSSTTVSSILKGARASRNSNTVTSNDSSNLIDNRNLSREKSTPGDSSPSDGRQTSSSFSKSDSEKLNILNKANNSDFIGQGINDSINQSGTLLRRGRSKGAFQHNQDTTTTSSSVVGFVDDVDGEGRKGRKSNSLSHGRDDNNDNNVTSRCNNSGVMPDSGGKKSETSKNTNTSDSLSSSGPPVVRSGCWSDVRGDYSQETKNDKKSDRSGMKDDAKTTNFEDSSESSNSSDTSSQLDPTASSRRMGQSGVQDSVHTMSAEDTSSNSETVGKRERVSSSNNKSMNRNNNSHESPNKKKSKMKFPKVKLPKFKFPENKFPKFKSLKNKLSNLKLPSKMPFKIPSWPKNFCAGNKDGVVDR